MDLTLRSDSSLSGYLGQSGYGCFLLGHKCTNVFGHEQMENLKKQDSMFEYTSDFVSSVKCAPCRRANKCNLGSWLVRSRQDRGGSALSLGRAARSSFLFVTQLLAV